MRLSRFMLLIFIIVFSFCGKKDSFEREKRFYRIAFDSLYNTYSEFSAIKNETNIRVMTQQLAIVCDNLVRTKQNLKSIALERAENRKELFRLANAADKAGEVFYVALVEKVYQYIKRSEEISERIGEITRTRSRYPILFGETANEDISRLEKEEGRYQELAIEGIKEFAMYIGDKSDSLREAGWLRYLEWRKYNEDVEPTGEIDW